MRPEKPSIVADIKEKLDASPFLLVIEYSGLTVEHFAELRERLDGTNAECKVVKNSFLKLAAVDAGMPDFSAELTGQTAIVIGESDICAAAKIVKTFAAEFQKPVVKIGVLDGKLLTPDEVKSIADLPSREVLLGTLLGVLQAPASKLVRLLNEPGSQLARILQAKGDQA